ncbi:MAG TPA: ferritin-like domain-containing protein [Longimicrobiaceae bacterium]|nr:ferritin-like domain-containing protein [Longimicrobiaceae bacterium]
MDIDATRLEGHAPALTEILDGLNDLLQLDHDALGAYDVAIEKLEDRDHASQIAGFRRDHERHIHELNLLIAELGGTPKNHPHATGPFKQALQGLGGLAGDKGLLMAFRTNELQVRTKYDSYASKANLWPHNAKRMIDQAALDEERHYAWVADVLQRMGVGAGEDPAVDALDRARERAATGQGVMHQAKERVGEVAGQVKEKVSELAGTVGGGVSGGARAVANRVAGLLDGGEERVVGAANTVGDAVGRVRGGIASGLSSAGRGATEAREGFEDRVREKPLQTLLVAGVAGFIIGRLLR